MPNFPSPNILRTFLIYNTRTGRLTHSYDPTSYHPPQQKIYQIKKREFVSIRYAHSRDNKNYVDPDPTITLRDGRKIHWKRMVVASFPTKTFRISCSVDHVSFGKTRYQMRDLVWLWWHGPFDAEKYRVVSADDSTLIEKLSLKAR